MFKWYRLAGTLAAASACAILILPQASAQNLILNGSFETPDIGSGFKNIPSPSNYIDDWVVGTGVSSPGAAGVDLINTYWGAEDGVQSIDTSGLGAGSLTQTVTTTTLNQEYNLSFWLAGNPDGPPDVKPIEVDWDNVALGTLTPAKGISKTEAGMGWTQYVYDVTGTGDDTLEFESQTDTAYGPALDNVSLTAVSPNGVTPVPEPAFFQMGLLLGLGALGLRRRRTAASAAAKA